MMVQYQITQLQKRLVTPIFLKILQYPETNSTSLIYVKNEDWLVLGKNFSKT